MAVERVMFALALLGTAQGGCGKEAGYGAPDRFEVDRAWQLVELQVKAGQRPPARLGCARWRGGCSRCCPWLLRSDPGRAQPAQRGGDAARHPGVREARFVLFDGEEPPAALPGEVSDFYSEGLRGSRAYVEAHGSWTGEMILLDYVGGRGLRLPREATSTEWLWRRLLGAAD